jgi:hypothetical protein
LFSGRILQRISGFRQGVSGGAISPVIRKVAATRSVW